MVHKWVTLRKRFDLESPEAQLDKKALELVNDIKDHGRVQLLAPGKVNLPELLQLSESRGK